MPDVGETFTAVAPRASLVSEPRLANPDEAASASSSNAGALRFD
eukprot:CAMPEP_0184129986 /NCGR_PEP_ID=MMETSP0974-20121125/27368_1 /TAXON_ID=483370 /ORGANISM="non described non described, Strain CCMP2097" /LENGTH=43 /DNA_ID= /DNA_START= /DNA_END= /DNA_ORIENTATION=